MKNYKNTDLFAKEFKISKAFAIEIVWHSFLDEKKIYLNRGNYASSTIGFLAKNFGAIFERGNDAPKGGKRGAFVIMTSWNSEFDKFANQIIKRDEEIGQEALQREIEKTKALDSMMISEEEKNKFIEKTTGLSNKQARKIAHNFAAKKLGFYSTEGMKKFMEL